MNAEAESFRRRVRDLRSQFQRALAKLESDEARKRASGVQGPHASGEDLVVEAQLRQYFLDPFLASLGWTLDSPENMTIEDGFNSGVSRRRLDYHGRDTDGRSLAVVEAKRSSVALPDSSPDHPRVLAEALVEIRKGSGKPPVTIEWREILIAACDYSKLVTSTHGEPPLRFVITNGQWFIVFRNVSATLLAKEPSRNEILVFPNLEAVEEEAAKLYELLSYRALSGHIPRQPPAALSSFVPEGQEVLCARFVDVSYVRHGERQPLISVCVGMWVRLPSGAWVVFQHEYPKDFLFLSDDGEMLGKSRAELNARAEALLKLLQSQRPLRFATAEEFEAAPPKGPAALYAADRPATPLIREIRRDLYRIVTRNEVLFLIAADAYDDCRYHSHGRCSEDGSAVGLTPIVAQSVDDLCFFPSGSQYHCAHTAIEETRKVSCLLTPFERHLCCRRCVFLSRCWPTQAMMPCETSASVASPPTPGESI